MSANVRYIENHYLQCSIFYLTFSEKFPVETGWIKTYGSVQSDEANSETVKEDYFLFDVKQIHFDTMKIIYLVNYIIDKS